MKDKPNILFDLDGTLVHSLPGIEEALRATLRTLGRDGYSRDAFRPLVGLPLATVFSRLLGEDSQDVDRAVAIYRGFYRDIGLPRSTPFEGIPELLHSLQKERRSLYVVTARNEEMAGLILANNHLRDLVISVRGERKGDGRESKADLVAEVLRDHRLEREETVMVGDRRFDTEAALANGCASIGVTYGYGTRQELIEGGADLLAEDPGELSALLRD